jgi:5-hydroxyisourate hydrolase-like protein (transthyretin family)
MGRCAARLFTLVLLLASTTIVVWSQSSGVIEGQVLNGTVDEESVQGVPVTLWAVAAEEQTILLQQTTDAEGRFRFEDLDTKAYSYQLQATYQGVSYWSDTLTFPADQTLLSVPITVYETTESEAEVLLERAHLIIDPRPGVIQVQELQFFVNNGNRTYIGAGGEGGQTLQFALPVGAAQVQLTEALMACCIEETTEGFAYTLPVLPGVEEFLFGYELAFQSTNYTLRKELSYPVHYLDVFVTDTGVEVTGPRLTALEPISLQGQTYLHLSAGGLSKGDTLELNLAGLPLGPRSDAPGSTISPVVARAVMGVGTLLVILALAYPFFQKREGEAS